MVVGLGELRLAGSVPNVPTNADNRLASRLSTPSSALDPCSVHPGRVTS